MLLWEFLPDFLGSSFPLSFSLDSSSCVVSSVAALRWSLNSYCPLSSLNSFGLQATDPNSDWTKQPTKTPPSPKSHKEDSVIRVSETSSNRSAEDTWESLRQQGGQTSQPERKSTLNIHWKTDAEAPVLWPPDAKNQLIGEDPDAEKDWRQEEKGATGWDGWMASPTQWTWVWTNSRRQWRTGKPGVLQSMGLQRVRHDLVTER